MIKVNREIILISSTPYIQKQDIISCISIYNTFTMELFTKEYIMKLNKTVIGFFIFLHLGALSALHPATFEWCAVSLMLIMYWLTASIGICFGYHRYLTHKGMSMPKWLDYLIVFFGTLACQNGPIKWVAHHRMHHRFSDKDDDPHNASRGFWWSHIGWMLYHKDKTDSPESIKSYTNDINGDKFYQFLDKYFIHIQIALGILFYLIGGISWVVWGIFVRLVLVYHVTWLVNSACHKWGYKNFEIKDDLSTNCWWSAILSFGEGWHNNHHKYAKKAKYGLKFWEIDLTWVSIWILYKLKLIKNIKT